MWAGQARLFFARRNEALANHRLTLESELAGELHDARVTIACDFAKRPGRRGRSDRMDIRVVHRVECLSAELEVDPLVRSGNCGRHQGRTVEARALNGPRFAVAGTGAVGARGGKRTRVEPRIAEVCSSCYGSLWCYGRCLDRQSGWSQAGIGIAENARPALSVT